VTLLRFSSLTERSPSHSYLYLVIALDISPCTGMVPMALLQDS
jgi:hypothetical protein